MLCRRGGERDVCVSCGSLARPVMNRGTFYPKPGDTKEVLAEVTVKRTGLRYLKHRSVPVVPHRRFLAFRCVDCRSDYVYDRATETWWDLDDDDYGPEGSSE